MNEIIKKEQRGIESGDNKDLMLGRVLLMQKTSKFVEEGFKPGSLVNSLTKNEIKNTSFIPIVLSKYWDLYKVNGDKRDFEGRVFSENDPKLEGRLFYNSEEGKATATEVMSFISLVDGEPMVIAFSKSSYAAGKKLFTLARMSRMDLFAKKYKLLVIKETNDLGTFYKLDVIEDGIPDKEEFAIAESLYGSLGHRVKEMQPSLEGEELPEVKKTGKNPDLRKSTFTIKRVFNKPITTKDGKEITVYEITNSDGIQFGTFDSKIADLCIEAQDKLKAVTAWYVQKGKYLTIEKVEIVEVEEIPF